LAAATHPVKAAVEALGRRTENERCEDPAGSATGYHRHSRRNVDQC
jgi:hypothetical protein